MDKQTLQLLLSLSTTVLIPVATMAARSIMNGYTERIEKQIADLKLQLATENGVRNLNHGLLEQRVETIEQRLHTCPLILQAAQSQKG